MRAFFLFVVIISSSPLWSQQQLSREEVHYGTAEPIHGHFQEKSLSQHQARNIILKAIKNKPKNDPEQLLEKFSYKSYNKLYVDRQEELLNKGRNFLSEKVSTHSFEESFRQEKVEGINISGFGKPASEVILLNLHPILLYKNDFQILETIYASPLADNAFKNYSFDLLDTLTNSARPAYLISYKPKRGKLVPGLEGILQLDTATFAIQKVNGRFSGTLEMEIEHDFSYFQDEEVWFPIAKTTILKPGTGEVDISVFGGSIALGTVQRKGSILDILLVPGKIEKNLYMSSRISNYDISLSQSIEKESPSATVVVMDQAYERSANFWEINRQEPFSFQDELTKFEVRRIVQAQNITRRLKVDNAISKGFYPVKFFDFELSRFITYNNHEGIRLGFGGITNNKFSEWIRLNGYFNYGFNDRAFKYSAGLATLLKRRTGTWFHLNYTKDIREVGSFKYSRGITQFSILEPRLANVSFFYNYKNLQSSIRHRISPRFETELAVSQNDISQIGNYAFLNHNRIYRDYTISEAKLGILWRPFSKFLSAPSGNTLLNKEYPQFTGQISQSFPDFFGGDFNFTRLGLKIEYHMTRLNLSSTQLIIEGNHGFGNLPLTHAFHGYPNNLRESAILDRFSVAGKTAFETMYFNEFFSDSQLALHAKHQLSPFRITRNFRPELVLISRHLIGDFKNMEAHQNIEFNTLNHGFSEAGLEINQLFSGFGLSFAYRYGAYHLPSFKENFSFKFTFDLTI